jgi:hypothetical protein
MLRVRYTFDCAAAPVAAVSSSESISIRILRIRIVMNILEVIVASAKIEKKDRYYSSSPPLFR